MLQAKRICAVLRQTRDPVAYNKLYSELGELLGELLLLPTVTVTGSGGLEAELCEFTLVPMQGFKIFIDDAHYVTYECEQQCFLVVDSSTGTPLLELTGVGDYSVAAASLSLSVSMPASTVPQNAARAVWVSDFPDECQRFFREVSINGALDYLYGTGLDVDMNQDCYVRKGGGTRTQTGLNQCGLRKCTDAYVLQLVPALAAATREHAQPTLTRSSSTCLFDRRDGL